MLKQAENMDFDYLNMLRSNNAAWRLLASPQAAFVASFLYELFIAAGRRAITEQEFLDNLTDFINQQQHSRAFAGYNQSAKYYLGIWSDNEHGWLRKFYLHDEPHVDLTAAAQKAIEWLDGLKQQKFIGTESRLRTVFDLLHQIAEGTDTNPERRLALLEKEKAELERKIAAIKNNEPIDILDEVQVKERYMQAAELAKNILADFREVEENFRRLEMDMRDKIVTWTHGKGELLDEVFKKREGIADSEQGQSFDAFWKFLMMSDKQDDFTTTVDKVLGLKGINGLKDIDLHRIQRDWINAASAVQATVAGLSKQLRRYVDQSFLQEERRIYELLKHNEALAVAVRSRQPEGRFMEIDALAPEPILPLDRPLFVPPIVNKLQVENIEEGYTEAAVTSLFEQIHIDKKQLRKNIDRLLVSKTNVALSEVVQEFPLTKGLTELLGYIVLADTAINDSSIQHKLTEIAMEDPSGRKLTALLENVIFKRTDMRDK